MRINKKYQVIGWCIYLMIAIWGFIDPSLVMSKWEWSNTFEERFWLISIMIAVGIYNLGKLYLEIKEEKK